jgi:hypothetical protein
MGILRTNTKVLQDIGIFSDHIPCVWAICDAWYNHKIADGHLHIYGFNSSVQQSKSNGAVGCVRTILYCFVLESEKVNIRIHRM